MNPASIFGKLAPSFAACVLLAASMAFAQAPAADAQRTIWDGVYTKEQAERGSGPYSDRCGTCHGQTGRGGPDAPGVVGYAFDDKWADVPLGAYYMYLSTQMPAGRPRSLSVQAYVDVISYLLSLHGAPPGDKELPTDEDALLNIMITKKP